MKILVFVLMMVATNLFAGEDDQYRLTIGTKIFPTIVLGNLDLASCSEAGKLLILVVYYQNKEIADQVVSDLHSKIPTLSNYSVVVAPQPVMSLDKVADKVAGIFIAEPLNNYADKVVAYTVRTKTFSFSPFETDVQKGVLAGIEVLVSVKPVLNMETMNESKFRISDIFLKISKKIQ